MVYTLVIFNFEDISDVVHLISRGSQKITFDVNKIPKSNVFLANNFGKINVISCEIMLV